MGRTYFSVLLKQRKLLMPETVCVFSLEVLNGTLIVAAVTAYYVGA